MQVTVNFMPADRETREALEKIAPHLINFQTPGMDFVPLQGDLIAFGGDDSPPFEVCNRMFIWKSPEHLVLQPLLRVAPGTADQTTPAPT